MSEIENLNRRIRDLERELKHMTMQRDALQVRVDSQRVEVTDEPDKFKLEFEGLRNDAIERVTLDPVLRRDIDDAE